MSTLHLQIRDLEPDGNVAHLEKALEAVPGVNRVEIDLETRSARIEHHAADASRLLTVLKTQGYEASLDREA